MSRWIKLHCQLASHDLWLAEPFSRGQAWVDLLMLAQSKQSWIVVRGISIDLERGQVGHSEQTLALRWKWSRGKVRRFISELKKREMVDVKQDNKTTIISIIKFDTYQAKPTADGTADDTAGGTPDGHQTDTRRTLSRKKDLKIGKREEEIHISGKPEKRVLKTPSTYSPEFEIFWDLYPSRNGQKTKKAKAWDSFHKLTSNGSEITPEVLIEKIRVLAPTYGEFPRDAVTWINQRGWEDEVGPICLKPITQGAGPRPSKGQALQDQNLAAMNEWLASKGVQK